MIIWSEQAQLTGLTISVQSYEKIISVNRGGARLPYVQRVRSEVVAGLAQFRVIIREKVSPVDARLESWQSGLESWQSGLARLLYDHGNFLRNI